MLLKQGSQIFAFLEDGQLSVDFTYKVAELVKALQDASSPKSAAKGEITLKLKFVQKGASLDIDSEMSMKKPRVVRATTPLFVTADGTLSTDHPKQIAMKFGENVESLDERRTDSN